MFWHLRASAPHLSPTSFFLLQKQNKTILIHSWNNVRQFSYLHKMLHQQVRRGKNMLRFCIFSGEFFRCFVFICLYRRLFDWRCKLSTDSWSFDLPPTALDPWEEILVRRSTSTVWKSSSLLSNTSDDILPSILDFTKIRQHRTEQSVQNSHMINRILKRKHFRTNRALPASLSPLVESRSTNRSNTAWTKKEKMMQLSICC